MKKFLFVAQLLLIFGVVQAQQPISGQYNYSSVVSTLDTSFDALTEETFMIQIEDNKVALIINDTLVNKIYSRILKIDDDLWLIRDSLGVYCKLNNVVQSLLTSRGECSISLLVTGDTIINSHLLALKQNSVNCNGTTFSDIFAYDESDYVGVQSTSSALVFPVLPTGEPYLPSLFIREMNNEGKAKVTYSLVSKTSNVSAYLFEIDSDYKEMTYLDFMATLD